MKSKGNKVVTVFAEGTEIDLNLMAHSIKTAKDEAVIKELCTKSRLNEIT